MGTTKYKNGKDLTEAEGIRKKQNYREEHYKGFNDPDKHDGVITPRE